jgi:hypothetical protein
VNNFIVYKELFIFKYQLEEEAGSAEEQPASNKADAYTIVKGAEQLAPFFFTIG